MTHRSSPALLVLHSVRLLGFADSAALAARAQLDADSVERVLRDAEREGWVRAVSFADLEGWTLTETGKAENERRLAKERDLVDRNGTIDLVYRAFLPLNARLLRAITDWQLTPTADDRLAANDHTDRAWDARIMEELDALSAALEPLNDRLRDVLARFDGYAARFASALIEAEKGDPGWIDRTDRDSCHRVWFQLHEDLVATLGIDRLSESAGGVR